MAKTEMTVGDERAHAEPLRERQCLAILRLAALGIELIRVGCDVAEQVQRMGGEAGCDEQNSSAVGETPRVITLADLQASVPI